MAETIWKFRLSPIDEQGIEMPLGASILCAQEQYGVVCLWAIVDDFPTHPKEQRTIFLRGTGHPMIVPETQLRYIGTVQKNGGSLVLHVFEPKRENHHA